MHWPGDKIRREREARGLSQQQLAHLLSAAQPDNTTSTRSVTAWENGESRPSGRNLAALDRVFATTPLPTDILADLPAGSRDDLIAWALDEASDMQLLATLARRMGASRSTSLPDTDLRLPRRHGHTTAFRIQRLARLGILMPLDLRLSGYQYLNDIRVSHRLRLEQFFVELR